MGLGGVEIVLAVEERFEIDVPSEVLGKIRSVGDFVDYLVEALNSKSRKEAPCRTSVTFFRLRATLSSLGVPRKSVRPKALLGDLLPGSKRQAVWAGLRSRGLTPPSLRHSPILVWNTALLAGFAPIFALANCVLPEGTWWGVAASPLLFLPGLGLALRPGILLPQGCGTVEELVRQTASESQLEGPWTADEVFRSLLSILETQLDVDPAKVTRESRFIEDLGAG